MDKKELDECRIRLGLNKKQMAKLLDTPYRTYQDWAAGVSRIPGAVGVAVKCLVKENKK